MNIFYFVYSCEVGSHSPLQHERDPETELIHDFFSGKKWKSLTPSERAPCVQEAEKLRLKHMQVGEI